MGWMMIFCLLLLVVIFCLCIEDNHANSLSFWAAVFGMLFSVLIGYRIGLAVV